MTDDTTPPVGARVVDADGNEFEFVELDGYRIWNELGYNRPRYVEECQEPLLDLAWRLQQERDQLRAENAALRADKERLDWLWKFAQAEAGDEMGWDVLDFGGKDLRAAIDAARGDA